MGLFSIYMVALLLVGGCTETDFATDGANQSAHANNQNDSNNSNTINSNSGFGSASDGNDYNYDELTESELIEGRYKPVLENDGNSINIDDGRPLLVNEDGDYAVEKLVEIAGEEGSIDVACESVAKEETQTLIFTNPGSCPYAESGNLNRDAAPNAARNEQIESIEIPAGTKLCSISIEANTNVTYDDSLSILFEDYFLATNGFSPNTLRAYGMSAENGLYRYDWLKIRGKAYDKDQTFCMADTSCQIPNSQSNGPFNLAVGRDWFKRISAVNLYSKTRFNIKVMVTGNKQSSDCKHSGLTFNTTVKYVE